jgi:hypothetical protein
MNKKLLVIPVIVLVLTMVLAVTGFACDSCDCGCGDCPPPPCEADCSPGFWKNHTEIWEGETDFANMLAILQAKGNDPLFQYRFDVADYLNAEYPDADCD